MENTTYYIVDNKSQWYLILNKSFGIASSIKKGGYYIELSAKYN